MNRYFVRILVAGIGIALIVGVVVYLLKDRLFRFPYTPATTEMKQGITTEDRVRNIEIITEDLVIPWEIAFLPDGEILVTERPGTLKKIGKNSSVFVIEGVEHVGEGGLLGMTLHPDFENTKWIYLYLTTKNGEELINRVVRYRFDEHRLSEKTVIIDRIPGAAIHNGGRIAFGPDRHLYVTTGDAGNAELAQDTRSLAGKILRLREDGSIPPDNPFGNAIWSYGHRNSQGLTWDNKGQLWATEHGRSGILSGLDELNLIKNGQNYGWPIIQGDERREGMHSPIIQSGPDNTWAPAGAVYLDGSVFFAGLRGVSLYEAKLSQDGEINSIVTHFQGTFGRLRAVQIGRDGFLYVSTSNTDGRGEPRPGDDKIIKINPKIFKKNYND